MIIQESDRGLFILSFRVSTRISGKYSCALSCELDNAIKKYRWEYSLILVLMKWIRQRQVHLLGISFFFVFEFIFYYPNVFLGIPLGLPVYLFICFIFAMHIWFFNFGIVYLVRRIFTGLQTKINKRVLAFLLILPFNVLLITFFQSSKV